jgi:hypothetical protein
VKDCERLSLLALISLIKIPEELVAIMLSEALPQKSGHEIAVYIDPFRTVLLDEVTALDGAHDNRVNAQPIPASAAQNTLTSVRKCRPRSGTACPLQSHAGQTGRIARTGFSALPRGRVAD